MTTDTPDSPISRRDRSAVIVPGVSRRGDFAIDWGHRGCALVVVDIQRYLCPSGNDEPQDETTSLKYYSEHYQQQFPKVLANIVDLVEAFRSLRDRRDSSVVESTVSGTVASASDVHSKCEVIFTYLQSQTIDRRDISLDYKLSGPLLANIPTVCEDDDALFLPNCRPIMGSSSSSFGKGDLRVPKTSCDVFVSTNLDYLLRQLEIKHVVFVGQFTEQCVESAVRHAADLGYWGVVASDACVCGSSEAQRDSLQRMRGYARVVDTKTLLREIRQETHNETTRI